jgi:hypothetical protein
MERREYKHLVSSIIRLDFDSETDGWYLEFPKGGFFAFMKSDHKIAYWRKSFSQRYLHVEYLVDDRAINCPEYFDLVLQYLITVLNEYSRSKEYIKFWCALINFKKIINPASKDFQESLTYFSKISHKQKFSFDAECSRLFLYYCATYAQKKHPIDLDSPLLYSIALLSNF